MKPFDNIAISSTEPKNKADIWIKHCKNMFKTLPNTTTINGITFTNNGDGTITVKGTATKVTYIVLGTFNFEDASYAISGCPSNGSDASYKIYIINTKDFSSIANDWGKGQVFEANGKTGEVRLRIENGYTCNNLVFKPQLEIGTEVSPFTRYFEDDILINNSGVYRSILHYKRMILWKNENPKNTMEEQYLNLSTDDYDWIELICVRDNVEVTGNLFIISTGIIPKKGHFYLSESLGFDNDYSKIITRAVQYVNDKQYIAFPGRVQSSNSKTRSTDNSYLIPLYIIGYKFN